MENAILGVFIIFGAFVITGLFIKGSFIWRNVMFECNEQWKKDNEGREALMKKVRELGTTKEYGIKKESKGLVRVCIIQNKETLIIHGLFNDYDRALRYIDYDLDKHKIIDTVMEVTHDMFEAIDKDSTLICGNCNKYNSCKDLLGPNATACNIYKEEE